MNFVIPAPDRGPGWRTRNPVEWARNARHWISALVPFGYSPVWRW